MHERPDLELLRSANELHEISIRRTKEESRNKIYFGLGLIGTVAAMYGIAWLLGAGSGGASLAASAAGLYYYSLEKFS